MFFDRPKATVLFVLATFVVAACGDTRFAFAESPKPTEIRIGSTSPWATEFTQNGQRLVVVKRQLASLDDRTVVIFDAATGKQVGLIGNRSQFFTGVARAPSEPGQMVLVDGEGQLAMWEVVGSKPKLVENSDALKEGGYIFGIAACEKNGLVAVAQEGRVLLLPTTGRSKTPVEIKREFSESTSISFDASGSVVAIAGDREVVTHNTKSGEKIAAYKATGDRPHVAFSPTKPLLAFQQASDDDDAPAISLLDFESGDVVRRLKLPTDVGLPDDVGIDGGKSAAIVRFSPNGELVAAGNGAADVMVWNAASGELIEHFTDHDSSNRDQFSTDPIRALAFSPDSKRLATAAGDGKILIYRLDSQAKSGGETIVANGDDSQRTQRVWTSADGGYEIKASLVSVDGELVKLRRTDGRVVTVPKSKLSKEDIAWLTKTNAAPKRFPSRLWSTKDGDFQVRASFVSTNGASVKLQRDDGIAIEVPLALLTDADRKYVASVLADREEDD